MKRIALFSTILTIGLWLAACSNDDNNAVQYSTTAVSMRAITQKPKATEISASNFTDFYAYGYATDANTVTSGDSPSFMYGTKVTRNLSGNEYVWSYSPIKYWPLNGYLSFFCFGPVGSAAQFTPEQNTNGMPALSYTVADKAENQEDLVWANAMGLSRENNGESSIPLVFNHALSEVIFLAEGSNEGVVHRVSRVELFGLKNAGTFDLMGGLWSSMDGSTTYYAIDLTDDSGNGMDVTYNNLSVLTSSDNGNALMILPQQTTAGNEVVGDDATSINVNDGGAYLRITFGSFDQESGIEYVPAGQTYVVPLRADNDASSIEFEQGKRYMISMLLTGRTNGGEAEDGEDPTDPGTGDLLPIDFDVTINDFTDWIMVNITM